MALQQEISDAISRDLPNQVGGTLRKLLDEGEKDANKVTDLTQRLDQFSISFSNLREEKEKIWDKLIAAEALLEKYEDFELRQRNLLLEIAEIKQKAAEANSEQLLTMVKLVFHSPVYSNSVYSSGRVPVPVQNGDYPMSYEFNIATTTTTQEQL